MADIKKDRIKRVKDQVEFIKKLLTQKTEGGEGLLVTIHVLRDQKVFHNYSYQDFKAGDWGMCMISMGVEARSAILNAETGASKGK